MVKEWPAGGQSLAALNGSIATLDPWGNQKGNFMRKIIILAAGTAMAIATAAGAQEATVPADPQATPAPQTAPAPGAQPAAPTIQSVNVVDFNELPPETQTQVDAMAKQRSAADIQKMRSSIDATPEIASALQAKGLSSADVVVASLSQNGALTLVTRKPAG